MRDPAPVKPRLRPHTRSPLLFIMECVRLRQWELETFPAWTEPDAVAAAIIDNIGQTEDDFVIGIRTRHARRYEAFLCEIRAKVELDLVGLSEGSGVPDGVIDYCARRERLLIQLSKCNLAYPSAERRSQETAASMAERERIVLAMTGLFVTFGKGDLEATARIARQHTPTHADQQVAQYWHVRNALASVAKRVGDIRADDAIERVMRETAIARDHTLRALQAWKQLTKLPGYKRQINHESMVAQAFTSGQLGQWLDEPVSASLCGRNINLEAAGYRLLRHCAELQGLTQRKPRRSRSVSSAKFGSRNASLSSASS